MGRSENEERDEIVREVRCGGLLLMYSCTVFFELLLWKQLFSVRGVYEDKEK